MIIDHRKSHYFRYNDGKFHGLRFCVGEGYRKGKKRRMEERQF